MLMSSAKLCIYLSQTRTAARQLELSKLGRDYIPIIDLLRREIAIVSSRDVSLPILTQMVFAYI